MDYTRLGKRIKEERLRLNLTQEKLSEKVGISTAYLGQIERGERCITLDKLIPLAQSTGLFDLPRNSRTVRVLPVL